MTRSCLLLAASSLLLPACVASETGSDTSYVSSSAAPMLGVEGGQDGADRSCHVMLRKISRVANNTGGYQTSCVPNGGCYYVWQGELELSDEAVSLGATPVVLLQTGSNPNWWRFEAEPTATAGRYAVRIDEHTVADGMSTTALMRTVMQLAPAIELPDGSRLFDHNRHPGDFDNYVLDSSNGWAIADDPAACTDVTQQSYLRFQQDWRNVQQGALVAGGRVSVDYDLARLPQCVGSTYQGSPAWSTLAHARFRPSGVMTSGPVSEYAYVQNVGYEVVPVAWELELPVGTTSVELWFETSGESCATSWDSNYGANFVFPVLAAPALGGVGWVGDGGVVVARGSCSSAETSGIPESVVLDSWALTRADCLWADIDVYAAGITDQSAQHPEWLEAQVAFSRDGGEIATRWLSFVGRVGNNYRYRWQLWDGNDFIHTPWDAIAYGFRFSLDGSSWTDDGMPYRITRGADFCPADYWGPEHCP